MSEEKMRASFDKWWKSQEYGLHDNCFEHSLAWSAYQAALQESEAGAVKFEDWWSRKPLDINEFSKFDCQEAFNAGCRLGNEFERQLNEAWAYISELETDRESVQTTPPYAQAIETAAIMRADECVISTFNELQFKDNQQLADAQDANSHLRSERDRYLEQYNDEAELNAKLMEQLAAANGRVEMLEKELSKFQESSFNPDWSLLKASQDSLREHMALLHRQNSQIEVLKDLLERAQNGLRWYADMHQEDVSEADGELHIEIDAALSDLPEADKEKS